MKPLDRLFDIYERLQTLILKPVNLHNSSHWAVRFGGGVIVALIVLQLLLGFMWNNEPDRFDVIQNAAALAEKNNEDMVTGYITTATLIKVAQTLMDKPGGYLSNDILPPGLLMDNIPNWEYGVLVQVRDLSLSLRNDISRSQSQSVEDKDLIAAENLFRIDSNSWLFPSAEGEYSKGISALQHYLHRLTDDNQQDAQFYSRADNLSAWLGLIEKRLGSLSQQLSASVGQDRINMDLAGDNAAIQSTRTPKELRLKTAWTEIDDIFYNARGQAWALSLLLKAAEADFQNILEKKNALISLRQIIRELDETQKTVWSPFILNGGGFGFFANHSLVMANYISRANAAVIDLRNLLSQG